MSTSISLHEIVAVAPTTSLPPMGDKSGFVMLQVQGEKGEFHSLTLYSRDAALIEALAAAINGIPSAVRDIKEAAKSC